MSAISDSRILIIATDGFEQEELVGPRDRLRAAGAEVVLASPNADPIQGMNHAEKGEQVTPDTTFDAVDPDAFDALLIPGGVANPDRLRLDEAAVRFVRDFAERDKPIAAICHGPWVLIEADAVRGRTLTSYPSLKTDVTNAGGEWQDKEVVVDQKLVTSRKPDDLPAFCDKLLSVFASAVEERSLDRMVEQTFPASDPLPGPTSTGAMSDKRVAAREEAAPPA